MYNLKKMINYMTSASHYQIDLNKKNHATCSKVLYQHKNPYEIIKIFINIFNLRVESLELKFI